MLEVDQIVGELHALSGQGALTGQSVLLTAGPTREALDPVRYISNRSSGKMGYALAEAATAAGASVTLVSGPVTLDPPHGVRLVRVETAQQMLEAVLAAVDPADIFIGAAAVADYCCATPARQKIKKTDGDLNLHLSRTPDILATVAKRQGRLFVVGFAAETEALEENARAKLLSKSLDMVVANRVDLPGIGFDSDNNAVGVFWASGSREFARADKTSHSQRADRIDRGQIP